jgi:hypothetical protein
LNGDTVESGKYFDGVDWSRTRAYTMGLGGMYLNLQGRESCGIVPARDAEALKRELIERLTGLRDPKPERARSGESTRPPIYIKVRTWMPRPTLSSATRMDTGHPGMRPSAAPARRSSRTTSRPGAVTIASTRCLCPACCSRTGWSTPRTPHRGHGAHRARPVRYSAPRLDGRAIRIQLGC